jgi:hypothetical protein
MKPIEAGKLNTTYGKQNTWDNILVALTKGEQKKNKDSKED